MWIPRCGVRFIWRVIMGIRSEGAGRKRMEGEASTGVHYWDGCWREQGLKTAGNWETRSTGRTGAACQPPATVLHWLRVTLLRTSTPFPAGLVCAGWGCSQGFRESSATEEWRLSCLEVQQNTRCPVQFSSIQSLSHVQLFATPWIAARQASLSITNSRSSLRLMSIESVMPSSHLILSRPLLLLPPIPPSIKVFSNESTLHEVAKVLEFQL